MSRREQAWARLTELGLSYDENDLVRDMEARIAHEEMLLTMIAQLDEQMSKPIAQPETPREPLSGRKTASWDPKGGSHNHAAR